MAKLKLDLHDIYNNSAAIDKALNDIFEEAIEKRSGKWRSYPAREAASSKKRCSAFYRNLILNPSITGWRTTAKISAGCLFILSFERALKYIDIPRYPDFG